MSVRNQAFGYPPADGTLKDLCRRSRRSPRPGPGPGGGGPRRDLAIRRHRRRDRLPHRPAVHVILPRQRPDRHPVPLPVETDSREQLHSPLHPAPPDQEEHPTQPRSGQPAQMSRNTPGVSPAIPARWGQIRREPPPPRYSRWGHIKGERWGHFRVLRPIVTLAGAQAVAVQAAASITLAALLWPLLPAAGRRGRPGQRAGPAAAAAPGPGAAGGRCDARIGRCGTGRDRPRRPAGGGARGRPDHAGGGGGVRAAGPVHWRHCAGRTRAGADARRGAGGAAGADAVPGGDRNRGVHQPGRGRPRAGPAPAARCGRRGAAGLPAGGLGGRAVPHARAGRRDTPAPVPPAGPPVRPGGGRGRHLRLPRARRGPLPGPGCPGAGPAAALAGAAAGRHRQLPDRRRARYRMGQLAVCAPVPLADRDPARGLAGRRRLRRGGPPPDRARGGAGRAERLLPGPAVPALPDRRGPGRRRLPGRRHRGAAGRADPRPGRHRPGRGPPGHAGGSRPARQVAKPSLDTAPLLQG